MVAAELEDPIPQTDPVCQIFSKNCFNGTIASE